MHRHYLPERPTGAIVSLVVVGSTSVGWVAATTAQSTEPGIWISPRGTALTEEFICAGKHKRLALPANVNKTASDFVPRIATFKCLVPYY